MKRVHTFGRSQVAALGGVKLTEAQLASTKVYSNIINSIQALKTLCVIVVHLKIPLSEVSDCRLPILNVACQSRRVCTDERKQGRGTKLLVCLRNSPIVNEEIQEI
jgi:hypothetical protein